MSCFSCEVNGGEFEGYCGRCLKVLGGYRVVWRNRNSLDYGRILEEIRQEKLGQVGVIGYMFKEVAEDGRFVGRMFVLCRGCPSFRNRVRAIDELRSMVESVGVDESQVSDSPDVGLDLKWVKSGNGRMTAVIF